MYPPNPVMDTNQRSVDAYLATELILDRLRLLQYLNLAIGGHHVDALAQVPILCGFFARSPSQSLELDVLCSHNYLCMYLLTIAPMLSCWRYSVATSPCRQCSFGLAYCRLSAAANLLA